jgi:hypothetical protein
MPGSSRVSHTSAISADDVFTPEFQWVIAALHDRFDGRVDGVRKARLEMLARAAF